MSNGTSSSSDMDKAAIIRGKLQVLDRRWLKQKEESKYEEGDHDNLLSSSSPEEFSAVTTPTFRRAPQQQATTQEEEAAALVENANLATADTTATQDDT